MVLRNHLPVVRVQLVTGGRYGELPVELDALGISFPDNSQDFSCELVDSWNAPVKATASDGRELDLDHVEPTGGLGRVNELELLSHGKRFISRQMFIESTGIVGVQIVLNESNALRLRPASQD